MSATYYSFAAEAMYNGQWFNIDYWYRNAEGQMKHRYPLVISERQLICETYEDLLRIKRRMTFDELAPTTQEIICNQHPYFSRETLAEWNYFLWGELHDLEAMLELEPHPDEHLNKERFHSIVAEIRRQRYEFWLSIPDTPGLAIENCQVRIITWG